MPEARVSVVIVIHNSGLDVIRCVQSLPDAISAPFETVVIDNASTDGMLEMLTGLFPRTTGIRLESNIGFARAVNMAMRQTSSPYVLILNPDTVAAPGAIEVLLDFAERQEDLGLAAPRLRYPDGRDQATARSFPTAAAGIFGRRSPLTKRFPGNPWSRKFLSGLRSGDAAFRCDWVSGACMLVPRSTITATGGFDERYFLFWEDADWCHRMAQQGLAVWTVPDSVVHHAEGGSRRGWPSPVIRHFHRGAYLYWKTFEAPQPWNPLRWMAAGALAGRAMTLIAAKHVRSLSALAGRRSRPPLPAAAPAYSTEVRSVLEPVRKDILA